MKKVVSKFFYDNMPELSTGHAPPDPRRWNTNGERCLESSWIAGSRLHGRSRFAGTRADGRLGRRQFGIEGVTVLAVRPDRYIGLHHDGTDASAVLQYPLGFTD
jgi:hypothetical protein